MNRLRERVQATRAGRLAGPIPTLLDRFLPQGALLLSVLTLVSYVTGLLAKRTMAQRFGAAQEYDAFNAAFILPELTLGVLVASGLAAPFIPIYTGLRRAGTQAAHEFAQTILTLAVLVMVGAAAILLVVAPLTVEIVAPGFDAATRVLYTDLFRVMLITVVLFAGSIALGEVLIAERRFLFYALAPILYNAGIIFGAAVLSPSLGIFGPAVGAIIGATLHLGIRLVGSRRAGFRIRPRLALGTAAVREFIRLMLPKTGSSPIEPLTFLFFTNVASTIATGSVVALNLARDFQSVPVSLVGVAFSLAAFPLLARAYADADRATFVRLLRTNLISIGLLTTAAAVGLVVVGGLAIRIFVGGGAFDDDAVALTTAILSAFALSVPFESLAHLLSRAIYATRHTLLQVVASLIGFGVTVMTTLALVPGLGVIGIPIGFTIGGATRVVLLSLVLVPRLRRMSRLPG